MKGIFAVALGILALVAAGCGSLTGLSNDGTGKSYVKLSVNWNTLNPKPMSQAVVDQVTIIGARVIAPNDHAVLAQSATKQQIDANGVITLNNTARHYNRHTW